MMPASAVNINDDAQACTTASSHSSSNGISCRYTRSPSCLRREMPGVGSENTCVVIEIADTCQLYLLEILQQLRLPASVRASRFEVSASKADKYREAPLSKGGEDLSDSRLYVYTLSRVSSVSNASW